MSEEKITTGEQIGAVWKVISAIITIVIAIWLLSSCQTGNTQQTENSQLTIKTTIFVGDVETSTLSTLSEAYHETELCLFSDKETGRKYYSVRDDIEDFKIVDGVNHWKFSELVDENTKEPLEFETPTEFLNFFASKGYEMVEQKKGKYNIDYTFKKNS